MTHALLSRNPELPDKHVLRAIGVFARTSIEALPRLSFCIRRREAASPNDGSAKLAVDSRMDGPSSTAFAPPLSALSPGRTKAEISA